MNDMAISRKGWPPGPWDTEPDRIEWRAENGMPCLMVRNQIGAWCGYVGVPPGHPWHGQEALSIEAAVHGGVTYASACAGRICHVAQPGEPEPWWVGFDTAHTDDMPPFMLPTIRGMLERMSDYSGYAQPSYKDVPYVRAEIEHLVEQANAVREGNP